MTIRQSCALVIGLAILASSCGGRVGDQVQLVIPIVEADDVVVWPTLHRS